MLAPLACRRQAAWRFEVLHWRRLAAVHPQPLPTDSRPPALLANNAPHIRPRLLRRPVQAKGNASEFSCGAPLSFWAPDIPGFSKLPGRGLFLYGQLELLGLLGGLFPVPETHDALQQLSVWGGVLASRQPAGILAASGASQPGSCLHALTTPLSNPPRPCSKLQLHPLHETRLGLCPAFPKPH